MHYSSDDLRRYVVVLTKADKSDNSVSKQVLESVIRALREAGVSRTPVVLTSATSKQGRDGMWRYVLLQFRVDAGGVLKEMDCGPHVVYS